jgi:tetratricopeptide (TPR) repeat protein
MDDKQTSLSGLVADRVDLEQKLQNEKGELSPRTVRDYEVAYARLQKNLIQLFRQSTVEGDRVTAMLELMRILENKLVYLHNFTIDPTSDSRMLASLVSRFIDEVSVRQRGALTPLEATYYRAICALYAGDVIAAAERFRSACESEESDEANDIKYKSYVILGNLSHEAKDYAGARDLHHRSLQYSHNANVTAQAIAFKALNAYALHDHDEALELFERSLELFDRNQPFFNSYFHRNALLFCGAIYYDRKQYEKAAHFYERVLNEVEQHSYDHFDALSHLGKIAYARNEFDAAAGFLSRAVSSHARNENEYLVDTYFWLAKAHLRRNDAVEAKKYLERIAASDVPYDKRSQAAELLLRVS